VGKVLTIDKGSSLVIQVHDRSFGGGVKDILRLDEKALNLLCIDGYQVYGAPAGGGGNTPPPGASLQLNSSGRADRFTDVGETWGREFTPNFDIFSSTVKCNLSGIIQGNGTYRIRIGGNSGTPDGTVVCTLTVADGGGYPNRLSFVEGQSFVNPGGFQLVKLTCETPSESDIYAQTIYLLDA
jgi:hypothetical protein